MKTYVDVNFVVGEYGGVKFPPAPTRLLQAIVAGSGETYAALLRLLEVQTPVIYASRDYTCLDYATYVPNNDERLEHANAASKKNIVQRVGDLRVVYEYDIVPELFPVLRDAVGSMQALGRAGDWVIARATETVDVARLDKFEPREGGTTTLRVPAAGFIDSVFNRFKNGTALRFTTNEYTKNAGTFRANCLFELTDPVRREYASHVVSWVRHAAMKRLPDKLSIDISGHGDHERRLVITPVTTLDYGDDMIRRIVVTAPDAVTGRTVTAKMAGLHVIDDDGTSRGYVVPVDSDAVFSQYLSPSKRWMTVTPILGRFDNGDTRQRARNFRKMFEQAGLPTPKSVTYIPRSDRMFVGKHHGHDKLPRMHVAVEFKEPVSGVVAVGAGRYAGLGIFANLSQVTEIQRFA
jgi:CRISPR-associated protein Csb2